MLAHAGGAVVVERTGGVGRIKLNRPSQINAINDSIRVGIPRALQDLDAATDIRVVVISGEGPKGFCAGADIKETREAESVSEVRDRMNRSAWIEAVDRMSKPVICAIHGVCMGGGLELALACDIRIASKDAVFALPEVGLGLIPGGGGTQRLARVVGLGRALDMILTGERLDAEEAKRIGLISRLSFSPGDLEKDVQRLANRLASTPPIACALARDAVRNSLEQDLERGLRHERDLFAIVMSTDDRTEAARAFREKRSPQFSGR